MPLSILISSSAFLALLLFSVLALRTTAAGRPMESRVRALAATSPRHSDLASLPFRARVVLPFVESVGRWAASILPGGLVRRIERRLVLSGRPMRAATLYTVAASLGVLLAGTYVVAVLLISDGTPSGAALAPAALCWALGALLPFYWLSSRARARKARMLRSLPDSLDLLTISVEAGLSLDGAFSQVAEKQPGPFADELRQMLREIGLGKTRRQALLDLADRTEMEDIGTFVNAIIQAEQLGTGLARVLRAQTRRLRDRRRQRAEQDARRAPVKMVFPLVFCLMPSLFIFILGPFVVSVVDFLTHT